ncbi:uncharacterized protein IWZ02DRAFT_430381 [Phyllosticta citriasiana]|uniref:uncharacterized protein n=1 Tax=Phyllosticta citriasiana TaxID=595635 RepID=UPI0030FD8231
MPNVTENAIIPLRPGVDLESADSPDAQAWRQTLAILAEQPGCVRLATGMQVENPDVMQMLVEWTSVQDHANFMAAPAYEPFFNHIKSIMSPTAAPILTHHTLSTSSSSLTSAPVTELVSFYFPPLLRRSHLGDAAPKLRLRRSAARAGPARLGARLVRRERCRARQSDGGGWQKDAFRETIGGLRALASGVEMHHVVFKEYQG